MNRLRHQALLSDFGRITNIAPQPWVRNPKKVILKNFLMKICHSSVTVRYSLQHKQTNTCLF